MPSSWMVSTFSGMRPKERYMSLEALISLRWEKPLRMVVMYLVSLRYSASFTSPSRKRKARSSSEELAG